MSRPETPWGASSSASSRATPNSRLSVGEVSRRSGVSPAALRYYEDIGMISSVRAATGHRRYGRHVLRRLAVIAAGQRVGLSLAQIRNGFRDLPLDRAPTRSQWTSLTTAWRAHIDVRIRELQVLGEELDGCIGCGCLSLDRCPLYNPNDQAAAEGRGARLLRRAAPDSAT